VNENLDGRFNILDFIGCSGNYWGEVSQTAMRDVIEKALKDGYLNALLEITSVRNDLAYYLLSQSRIDWFFHCLAKNNSRPTRLLDVGSGWGTLSFLLAEYFDEVWSVEPVYERAVFQAIKREQTKAEKVRIVRCWAHKLPFPNDFFDLVIANGLLEWVPFGDLSKNPKKMQLEFLREAYRILKIGGCLYIGIENRIAYNYFLGSRDHSGLPYTSLLPRPLAGLSVALLGGYKNRTDILKKYVTYTYSALGYKKLLTLAGFNKVEIYCTDNYNLPAISYRLTDIRAFNNHLQGASAKKPNFISNFILKLPNIVKYPLMFLSPCFLIFAYKGLKPETFESKLLNLISSKSAPSFVRISGNIDVTYHFFDSDGRPIKLVRVPRFKDDQSKVEKKEKILIQINRLQVEKKHLLGIPVFFEEYLNGIPFDILNPEHNLRALDWLFSFQKKTCKGYIAKDEISSEIKDILNHVKVLHIKYEKSIEESLKNLITIDHIRVSEHGDFWGGNIFFYNGRLYVLDWEDYNERGNHLFDPVFFVITNSLYTEHPNSLLSFYKNWTGTGQYSPILKRILLRFKDTFNLDPSILIDVLPYIMLKKIISCDPRTNNWRNNYFIFQRLLDVWHTHRNEISRYLASF